MEKRYWKRKNSFLKSLQKNGKKKHTTISSCTGAISAKLKVMTVQLALLKKNVYIIKNPAD